MYGYPQPAYPAYAPPMAPGYPVAPVAPMAAVGISYPGYRQIQIGPGIDMNEYTRIVNSVITVHSQYRGALGTATAASQAIKLMLGGEWMVLVTELSMPAYDFSITRCKGGDSMVFSLDNKKYEVLRV